MDLEKYNQLKTTVDTLEKRVQRAEGALEQLMARLLRDFELPSLKAARQQLAALDAELKAKEKVFQRSLEEFSRDADRLLGDVDATTIH